MRIPEWVGPAIGAICGGGGVGGLWAHLSARTKAKAEAGPAWVTATAAFQQSLTTFQQSLTAEANRICDELRETVTDLRMRVDNLEAENDACRGENRQLSQRIYSLEEQLRRSGVPISAREMPGSFVTLEGGNATVMTPSVEKLD